jgi:signal peptidase I
VSARPPGNGDHPDAMTGGHPHPSVYHQDLPVHYQDLPVRRPAANGAAGSGRHSRGPASPAGSAIPRAATVRPPQELDYRLRGLNLDPADYVPTAPTRPERRRRRPRRVGPLLIRVIVPLTAAALAAWLVQAFVARPFAVPGMAMAPTLQPGDRLLAVMSEPLERPIQAGQIVVFRPPKFLPCTVGGGSGGDLVLRVVALPGQKIWSIDKTIFVDGQPLRERGWYNPRSGQIGSRPIRSTTLAQNQYFVLGDNRSDACDSRVFGPISKSSIVGEGIAIVVRDGHVFLRKL